MWRAIAKFCQNGCDYVILVRASVNQRIVAYCRGCGAVWRTPADYDENNFVSGYEELGVSVGKPTEVEFQMSDWLNSAYYLIREEDSWSIAEINNDLQRAYDRKDEPREPPMSAAEIHEKIRTKQRCLHPEGKQRLVAILSGVALLVFLLMRFWQK